MVGIVHRSRRSKMNRRRWWTKRAMEMKAMGMAVMGMAVMGGVGATEVALGVRMEAEANGAMSRHLLQSLGTTVEMGRRQDWFGYRRRRTGMKRCTPHAAYSSAARLARTRTTGSERRCS
jgi:hypothetical protein